jgi:hypothetical protein
MIAEDSSTPAVATASGSGTLTATSASFTPPAGALIIADCGAGNSNANTGLGTVSWASGGNGTWHRAVGLSNNGGAAAEIWYCQLTTAPGASTVQYVLGSAGGTQNRALLACRVLTGAQSGSAALGATATFGPSSGSGMNVSITPQAYNSYVAIALGGTYSTSSPSVESNTTQIGTVFNGAGTAAGQAAKLTALTSSTSATVVGWTSNFGSSGGDIVALEVLGLPGVSFVGHIGHAMERLREGWKTRRSGLFVPGFADQRLVLAH